MKIIAIGDIHGRDKWKEIVARENDADKIVFIGDYFDTHEKIDTQKQITNFRDIIYFKRMYPKKVVLLCGNHDYHYFDDVQHIIKDRYSGFNEKHRYSIMILVDEAREMRLLEMCYQYNQFLFSHAGITNTWLKSAKINPAAMEIQINQLFYRDLAQFKFTSGENNSPYGDDVTQSPIWVRPGSLEKDRIKPFVHIVGHTSIKNIHLEVENIILIDTLASGEYLKIIDGEMSVGMI